MGAHVESRRVGIITLPGNFNYGNRLQCYAMVEAIRRMGCEPHVMERDCCFPWYRRSYYGLKGMLLRLRGRGSSITPEKLSTPERLAAFKRFGGRIPTTVLAGNGYRAGGGFDKIVVGSDQVWNPNGIAHQEKWYFAGFARREQRVAVAASLGIDEFTDEGQARRVSDGVKQFAHVSVREKRGADLIRECSGIEAEVICDPTLVLTAEEWRAVADGRLTPEGPYVLAYLLGGAGAAASEVLDRVADRGRIPVVPLSDRQRPGEPDAGPAEFISLIDHASHVVTDSFHAAVFSCILQTPLTVVRREGAGMFSRLESLAETLGIEEKIYGSPEYDPSRAGDYSGVPEAIAQERERFMSYLEGCLHG